jgi:site-specific DNA-methyltransferase (adenine-specific)
MSGNSERIMLINGDCIVEMEKLDTDSVDLIITDPPYNLANFMKDRQTNLVKMRSNFFGAAGWDEFEFEQWVQSMDRFFEQAHRVLKKKGAMIMFMSLLRVETIVNIAARHKFYYKTTGIWHKTNPMPRNMNLHFINSVEGWIYFINDGKTGTFNNNGRAVHDFIETSVTPGNEKQYISHPTQKPEALYARFIELLTNGNEVVLDPFMGSGTAGVVCKKLGRRFIGIEITEEYFEGARNRINNTDYDLLTLDSFDSVREMY